MLKSEFFKYCRDAQTEDKGLQNAPRLYVNIQGVYREMDTAVFLHGAWADNAIVSVQLYCPFPGRQWEHRDRYRDYLNLAEKKFKRWLAEYLAKEQS